MAYETQADVEDLFISGSDCPKGSEEWQKLMIERETQNIFNLINSDHEDCSDNTHMKNDIHNPLCDNEVNERSPAAESDVTFPYQTIIQIKPESPDPATDHDPPQIAKPKSSRTGYQQNGAEQNPDTPVVQETPPTSSQLPIVICPLGSDHATVNSQTISASKNSHISQTTQFDFTSQVPSEVSTTSETSPAKMKALQKSIESIRKIYRSLASETLNTETNQRRAANAAQAAENEQSKESNVVTDETGATKASQNIKKISLSSNPSVMPTKYEDSLCKMNRKIAPSEPEKSLKPSPSPLGNLVPRVEHLPPGARILPVGGPNQPKVIGIFPLPRSREDPIHERKGETAPSEPENVLKPSQESATSLGNLVQRVEKLQPGAQILSVGGPNQPKIVGALPIPTSGEDSVHKRKRETEPSGPEKVLKLSQECVTHVRKLAEGVEKQQPGAQILSVGGPDQPKIVGVCPLPTSGEDSVHKRKRETEPSEVEKVPKLSQESVCASHRMPVSHDMTGTTQSTLTNSTSKPSSALTPPFVMRLPPGVKIDLNQFLGELTGPKNITQSLPTSSTQTTGVQSNPVSCTQTKCVPANAAVQNVDDTQPPVLQTKQENEFQLPVMQNNPEAENKPPVRQTSSPSISPEPASQTSCIQTPVLETNPITTSTASDSTKVGNTLANLIQSVSSSKAPSVQLKTPAVPPSTKTEGLPPLANFVQSAEKLSVPGIQVLPAVVPSQPKEVPLQNGREDMIHEIKKETEPSESEKILKPSQGTANVSNKVPISRITTNTTQSTLQSHTSKPSNPITEPLVMQLPPGVQVNVSQFLGKLTNIAKATPAIQILQVSGTQTTGVQSNPVSCTQTKFVPANAAVQNKNIDNTQPPVLQTKQDNKTQLPVMQNNPEADIKPPVQQTDPPSISPEPAGQTSSGSCIPTPVVEINTATTSTASDSTKVGNATSLANLVQSVSHSQTPAVQTNPVSTSGVQNSATTGSVTSVTNMVQSVDKLPPDVRILRVGGPSQPKVLGVFPLPNSGVPLGTPIATNISGPGVMQQNIFPQPLFQLSANPMNMPFITLGSAQTSLVQSNQQTLTMPSAPSQNKDGATGTTAQAGNVVMLQTNPPQGSACVPLYLPMVQSLPAGAQIGLPAGLNPLPVNTVLPRRFGAQLQYPQKLKPLVPRKA